MEEKTDIIPTKSELPKKNVLNVWMIVSAVLFVLLLVSLSLFFVKSNKNVATKPIPQQVTKQTKESFTLSFDVAGSGIETPISKYDHMLLASPSVISEQKTKSWEYLDCLSASEERDSYKFEDVNRSVNDQVLLNGLQEIEDYEYTTTIVNESGETIKEYQSKQDIDYASICKDDSNYYVLFLTTGDKSSSQSYNPFIREVKAAGGWSGYSNLAIISNEGDTEIFEKLNGSSENISIPDLSEGGFDDSTSRSFAYYACRRFVGKLDDDLYITCGGSGASGVFKVVAEPFSMTELSFCWWRLSTNERVCYDNSGSVYYTVK